MRSIGPEMCNRREKRPEDLKRNRGCCATESSFGPDFSGHGFRLGRTLRCTADAGAVSATAPAQISGEFLSPFAEAERE
jgi:hypothetical protein